MYLSIVRFQNCNRPDIYHEVYNGCFFKIILEKSQLLRNSKNSKRSPFPLKQQNSIKVKNIC